LIFLDPHHSSKFGDTKTKNTNFNLSGPVNIKESHNLPFDSSILQAQQVNIARDSNKSQQLVPDTNSTLAYTGEYISSNKGYLNKNANR